ncbi:MAG TPA: hypothetical protein VGM90_14110 [Kofleriaceae bacterium]|jgi:hypothetical protein
MATPPYVGANQSQVGTSDGWIAKLGSFFGGGSTPAYNGTGQPAPQAVVSMRGATTPSYGSPAPAATPDVDEETPDDTESSVCGSDCAVDPAQLAAGKIAIVIPRERLGPCNE